MDKDRPQPAGGQQQSEIFTAGDARSQGFVPVPLDLARRLGPAAQTMGALLGAFRQDGKTTARVQARLAGSAGVAVCTLRRHLRTLEENGLVATQHRADLPNRCQLLKREADVLGTWLPLPRYALGLPWNCRLVYAYVLFRADLSASQNLCPDGIRAIAKAVGMDRRNCRDVVAQLVADGYLEKGEGTPAPLWLKCPASQVGVICAQGRGQFARRGGGNLSDKKEVVVEGGFYKNQRKPRRRHLRRLTRADLDDNQRLAKRFHEALVLNLVPDTGRGRLEFFAAACHALRVAENPAAMFAANVAAGSWDHSTQVDEDSALARLRHMAAEHRKAMTADVAKLAEPIGRMPE